MADVNPRQIITWSFWTNYFEQQGKNDLTDICGTLHIVLQHWE